MRTITKADAFAALREVVRGREDFRYEAPGEAGGCVYVWTDDVVGEPPAPSCIVGCILSQLGVPLPPMTSDLNAKTVDALYGWLLDHEVDTDPAMQVLSRAQRHQDDGMEWGTVLAYVEEDEGAEEQ